MCQLLRFAILSILLLPVSAFARQHIVYGTLRVTSTKEAQLPASYTVALVPAPNISQLRNNPRLDFSMQVMNHGTYRFDNVPNGDWEVVLTAERHLLLRRSLKLDFVNPTSRQIDLQAAWEERSTSTLSNLSVISAGDFYPRSEAQTARMNRAMAAAGKENYAEAARLLETIVNADPRDFEAWTELGRVRFAQQDLDEAAEAFRRALDENPTYPVAMLNYGKLQYDRKDYHASITTLTEFVNQHPEAAEAHRFLGEAYLRLQQGTKAVPEFEKALRLDPRGQAEAHLSLAALYDAVGYKDRAAAEYEKFLAEKPDYPDKARLERYIQINRKQDRTARASDPSDRTDRSDPSDQPARKIRRIGRLTSRPAFPGFPGFDERHPLAGAWRYFLSLRPHDLVNIGL